MLFFFFFLFFGFGLVFDLQLLAFFTFGCWLDFCGFFGSFHTRVSKEMQCFVDIIHFFLILILIFFFVSVPFFAMPTFDTPQANAYMV